MAPKETAQDEINRNTRSELDELHKHADVANHEMGLIQVDVQSIKVHVEYMKEGIKSLRAQNWAIIILIVGAAVGIIFGK